MIDEAALEQALEEVQTLISADGGSFEVGFEDLESGIVSLTLVLEGAECEECVMPREFLEKVTFDLMRQSLPGLTNLTIDDPREHADYVPSAH
jgi:Fe-S cluster biogenesis protein NfuA